MGKHNFKPRKGREHVPQVAVNGEAIRAGEIPKYCTTEFFEILGWYQITKATETFPNGAVGWANEPASFIEAFIAFESEESLMQQEEREKREAEAKMKAAMAKSKSRGRRGRRR